MHGLILVVSCDSYPERLVVRDLEGDEALDVRLVDMPRVLFGRAGSVMYVCYPYEDDDATKETLFRRWAGSYIQRACDLRRAHHTCTPLRFTAAPREHPWTCLC